MAKRHEKLYRIEIIISRKFSSSIVEMRILSIK